MSEKQNLSGRNFAFLQNKYDLSDEDLFFLNKITGWADNSRQNYVKKYTGFLDESRQILCKEALDSVCCKNFCFFGGFENATRKMLCVHSDFEVISNEEFPIECLQFGFRRCDELSHRDFLGSLMALGITRESVGDILISEGKAQVFLTKTAAAAARNSIRKIGRIGVKISENADEIIVSEPEFTEISGTVSSLRLDCVLSFVAKISREKAAEEIKSGRVMVNHFVKTNISENLNENDEFSARGKGKFILKKVGNMTKKGKLHINVLKYI